MSDESDNEHEVKSGQEKTGAGMGASSSTRSSKTGREAQQNTSKEKQAGAKEGASRSKERVMIDLLDIQDSEWQDEDKPRP